MDLIQKYYEMRCVDADFIADNTLKWLQELFDRTPYDYNSKRMFDWYSRFFKDFVKNELYSEEGTIQLIFPRGMYDEKKRRLYKYVTAYFLFNQHYYKLENIQDEATIRECLGKLGMTTTDDYFNRIQDTAKKTQWCLYADDPLRQYIWESEEYEPSKEGCVQIGISITTYRDYEFKKQEKDKVGALDMYVEYLLKKERNTIADFRSSNALWNEAVKLTVRNRAERMEEQLLSPKEWLLFCLVLGMDTDVFKKLIRLQFKKFGSNGEESKRLSFIGNDEVKMLEKFLMDSYWRLRDAKRDVGKDATPVNKYAVPRQMLFNANKDLINNGLGSIMRYNQ